MDEEHFTISQVAARLGIEADTLRYYERRHVVPSPSRDAAGRRCYDANQVHLLEVLLHLKRTGMPLAAIADFTRLVATDPDGVPERLALLQQHRDRILAQRRILEDSLQVVEQKIHDYQARLQLD
ncbi:MerR family transcriptional regulator [Nigerium massiliense]|uniref:MerR family transcriptional regulator n=1 Tax=Nigerium massiliense TaxID=1522317 RepID=UPI001C437640|nr:MerR family transcriptional regulator [Nigerium massiliense]